MTPRTVTRVPTTAAALESMSSSTEMPKPAGSPVLIRVHLDGVTAIDGEWLGRKVQFFAGRGGHDWFALAGVDVEAPTGSSVLRVVIGSGKDSIDRSRTVEIHPAHYRTGTLTVPPKFVEPGPVALKQIEADGKLKAANDPSLKKPALLGSYEVLGMQARTALQVLKDTVARVLPYYNQEILPAVLRGERTLVAETEGQA